MKKSTNRKTGQVAQSILKFNDDVHHISNEKFKKVEASSNNQLLCYQLKEKTRFEIDFWKKYEFLKGFDIDYNQLRNVPLYKVLVHLVFAVIGSLAEILIYRTIINAIWSVEQNEATLMACGFLLFMKVVSFAFYPYVKKWIKDFVKEKWSLGRKIVFWLSGAITILTFCIGVLNNSYTNESEDLKSIGKKPSQSTSFNVDASDDVVMLDDNLSEIDREDSWIIKVIKFFTFAFFTVITLLSAALNLALFELNYKSYRINKQIEKLESTLADLRAKFNFLLKTFSMFRGNEKDLFMMLIEKDYMENIISKLYSINLKPKTRRI